MGFNGGVGDGDVYLSGIFFLIFCMLVDCVHGWAKLLLASFVLKVWLMCSKV